MKILKGIRGRIAAIEADSFRIGIAVNQEEDRARMRIARGCDRDESVIIPEAGVQTPPAFSFSWRTTDFPEDREPGCLTGVVTYAIELGICLIVISGHAEGPKRGGPEAAKADSRRNRPRIPQSGKSIERVKG